MSAETSRVRHRIPLRHLAANSGRSLFLSAAGLCLALSFPGPLSAQNLSYEQAVLLPDTALSAVTVGILTPGGSGADPGGLEGISLVLGQLMEQALRDELIPLGASADVEVGRDEVSVVLSSPRAHWEEALRTMEDILFGPSFPTDNLAEIRESLIEIVHFETGAPVREFENELAELRFGAGHPSSRPTQGTPASLRQITPALIWEHRTRLFDRSTAVIAAIGPLDRLRLESLLGGSVTVRVISTTSSGAVATSQPGTTTPWESQSTGELGWDEGAETVIDRPLTATWLGVAFPFPVGSPPLLLDFVAHLIEEELNPTPPEPGLYLLRAETEWSGAYPTLVISASVDPQTASRWYQRLTSSLSVLANEPPTGTFFELSRRRFRTQLILEQSDPFEVVRRVTRRLAVDPSYPGWRAEWIWMLQPEEVIRAARTAGPPRTLVFGPDAMMAP